MKELAASSPPLALDAGIWKAPDPTRTLVQVGMPHKVRTTCRRTGKKQNKQQDRLDQTTAVPQDDLSPSWEKKEPPARTLDARPPLALDSLDSGPRLNKLRVKIPGETPDRQNLHLRLQ